MDSEDARELFMQYDGSRFYMSRDGREAEYLAADVPPELQAAWLAELKNEKLRHLAFRGNWQVPLFFLHHADLDHLAHFIQARPRGVLWERCSFLDHLLAYAEAARQVGGDLDMIAQAARKSIREADRLLRRAKAASSINRIHDVLHRAHRLLREIDGREAAPDLDLPPGPGR
ncbi:hypothetical protein [Paludisphaera soli]|uniref:hypothetical protein n=1 Tax=Paludisphaera soli TaxID=2712865 RepID=UPI0013EDD9D1|nr:hypothetical protein [Paludisphaera soli]